LLRNLRRNHRAMFGLFAALGIYGIMRRLLNAPA
jgi:hypothetical protein